MAQQPLPVTVAVHGNEAARRLGLRADGQLAFGATPLVFGATFVQGAVRLSVERDGQRQHVVAVSQNETGRGLRLAAAVADFYVTRLEDGSVVLRCATPIVNFVRVDADGNVACTTEAVHATNLRIRHHDPTPTYVLRALDDEQAHLARLIRDLALGETREIVVTVEDMEGRVLQLNAAHPFAPFFAADGRRGAFVLTLEQNGWISLRHGERGLYIASDTAPTVFSSTTPHRWTVVSLGGGRIQLARYFATQACLWIGIAVNDDHTATVMTTTDPNSAAVLRVVKHTADPDWLINPQDAALRATLRATQNQLAAIQAGSARIGRRLEDLELLHESQHRVFTRAFFDSGAVTANHHYIGGSDHSPRQGYLHNVATGATAYCGIAHQLNWIQVDLGAEHRIVAIKTQGRHHNPQWVTRYCIQHSVQTPVPGSNSLGAHFSAPGGGNEFTGNSDCHTVVTHNVSAQNVHARYIRLVVEPTWFHSHPSLRWDVVFA